MSSANGTRTGLIDFACRPFDERIGGVESEAFDLALHHWFEQMAEQGPWHVVAQATSLAELPLCLEAADRSEGRISAFAAFSPDSHEETAMVFESLAKGRLKGLLLLPGLSGFRLDHPGLAPLFELAADLGTPIIVQCGLPPAALRDREGVFLDLQAANPLELVPVADGHPRVPFVVPAFGSGFFREALMLGELCENVFLGTAPGGAWRRTQPTPLSLVDLFERSLEVYGVERLLFGTGSGPTPPGWRGDLATLQREALGALELDTADKDRILADNARRLLRF